MRTFSGAGVAQRIQQIAVVKADLHFIALAVGVELVHHAAKVGLAAHHDSTLCKGDAEMEFLNASVIISETRSMVSMNSLVSMVTRVRLSGGDHVAVVEELALDQTAHDGVAAGHKRPHSGGWR